MAITAVAASKLDGYVDQRANPRLVSTATTAVAASKVHREGGSGPVQPTCPMAIAAVAASKVETPQFVVAHVVGCPWQIAAVAGSKLGRRCRLRSVHQRIHGDNTVAASKERERVRPVQEKYNVHGDCRGCIRRT